MGRYEWAWSPPVLELLNEYKEKPNSLGRFYMSQVSHVVHPAVNSRSALYVADPLTVLCPEPARPPKRSMQIG